jgi:hypothetical protein
MARKEAFFFAKKNQETFAFYGCDVDAGGTPRSQSFCVFLQKEALSCLVSSPHKPRPRPVAKSRVILPLC